MTNVSNRALMKAVGGALIALAAAPIGAQMEYERRSSRSPSSRRSVSA